MKWKEQKNREYNDLICGKLPLKQQAITVAAASNEMSRKFGLGWV